MSAVAFRFLLLQFDSSELMNSYYLQMDLPQIKDAFIAFNFEQLLQFFFKTIKHGFAANETINAHTSGSRALNYNLKPRHICD